MLTSSRNLISIKSEKTSQKAVKEVSYKPTPYLIASIKQSDKEYAAGDFQVAHSIEELEKQLRSGK